MTPKEKAIELNEIAGDIEIYIPTNGINIDCKVNELPSRWNIKRQVAILVANETIKTLVVLSNGEFSYINEVIYWEEVKKEINNL